MKRTTTILLGLLAASCSSTYGARWETITVRGVIPEDKARLTFEDQSAGAIVDRLEDMWKKRRSAQMRDWKGQTMIFHTLLEILMLFQAAVKFRFKHQV